MKIQNLGPIKELKLSLDQLNLFVGENGTGKTIAAYAIYAFVEWFLNKYELQVLNSEQAEQLIVNQHLKLSVATVKNQIATEVVDQFNSLSNGYFEQFFSGQGIYDPYESSIKIEQADVMTLLKASFTDSQRILHWPHRSVGKASHVVDRDDKLTLTFGSEQWELYYVTFAMSNGDTAIIRRQQLQHMNDEVQGLNQLLQQLLFRSSAAYLPAERIGIDVFRTDLNLSRLNRFNELVRGKQLAANAKKVYPQPIEDYISFLNNTLRLDTREREATWQPALRLMQSLVPGQFVYQTETDTLGYQLPNQESVVDFELLSSSLKSNLGLELFLRHGEQGDWLFVDEPEMNLHPTNQVKMAELQYQLLKLGVGQVISTHSDYYLKALINEVLADRLAGNDQAKQIAVYEFTNDGVRPLPNLFNDSINDSFDDVTNAINDRYYDLMEQLTDEEE